MNDHTKALVPIDANNDQIEESKNKLSDDERELKIKEIEAKNHVFKIILDPSLPEN